MAKNEKQANPSSSDENTNTELGTENIAAITPPRGFEIANMVDVADKSCDGWYSPVDGPELYGIIQGGFTRKSPNPKQQDQVVIKVVLATPLIALAADGYKGPILRSRESDGKRADIILLKPDQIVGVTIRAKIQNLLDYEDGSKVHIKAIGKKSIGGNQTMWEFEVHAAGKKKPIIKAVSKNGAEEDLPF